MTDLEKISTLKKSAKHGLYFYTFSIIKTFLTMVGIIFLVTELVNYVILLVSGVEVTIQLWSIPFACLITLLISPAARNYLKNSIVFILLYWSRYEILKTIEEIEDEDHRHLVLEEFMERELDVIHRNE